MFWKFFGLSLSSSHSNEVNGFNFSWGTQKDYQTIKDSNSQNSTMDYVTPLYYIIILEWPTSFISCNKHKDWSFKKIGAIQNVLKIPFFKINCVPIILIFYKNE
jgi:hypothetical protein